MTTFICTSNSGKLREFRHAFESDETVLGIHDLAGLFIKSTSSAEAEIPSYHEPKEDCEWFAGNALQKLLAALRFLENIARANPEALRSELFPERIVVDDSGLCVPALNFRPGVHSAIFAGLPRCDSRNREKLRAAIASLESRDAAGLAGYMSFGNERRARAFFLCVLLSMKFSKQVLTPFQGFSFAERTEKFCNEKLWPSRDFELKVMQQESLRVSRDDELVCELDVREFKMHRSEKVTIRAHYGLAHGFVSDTEQNLLPGEGHGYDALFYHESKQEFSFASIPMLEKNKLSHRGIALKGLVESLDCVLPT